MPAQHVTDETTLLEYLASPRRNRGVLQHVRYCARCQALVRRRRLARLQSCEGRADTGHIDEATLQAFARDQLNDGQMVLVMDHLRTCQQCVAAFERVHLSIGRSS